MSRAFDFRLKQGQTVSRIWNKDSFPFGTQIMGFRSIAFSLESSGLGWSPSFENELVRGLNENWLEVGESSPTVVLTCENLRSLIPPCSGNGRRPDVLCDLSFRIRGSPRMGESCSPEQLLAQKSVLNSGIRDNARGLHPRPRCA